MVSKEYFFKLFLPHGVFQSGGDRVSHEEQFFEILRKWDTSFHFLSGFLLYGLDWVIVGVIMDLVGLLLDGLMMLEYLTDALLELAGLFEGAGGWWEWKVFLTAERLTTFI